LRGRSVPPARSSDDSLSRTCSHCGTATADQRTGE
jgi:hypothetical protein